MPRKNKPDDVAQITKERDYYKSLVETFFSGAVPAEGGSIDHFIMMKWGKKRLESMRHSPALLRNSTD